MATGNINISAPNIIAVCVDDIGPAGGSGRLYHKYDPKPIAFREPSQMLKLMDDFYDWLGYPQSSTNMRSFQTKQKRDLKAKGDVKMLDDAQVTSKSGDKATFVVHVKYRQNATWQGSVVWAEQKKTSNFRSALELLKLIDSALDTAMEQDE